MSDDFVTVESYQYPFEAETAHVVLQNEGIPARLTDLNMVGSVWSLGNALGYIKLQVPAEHAERAKELLAEAKSQTEGGAASVHECPQCGLSLPNEVESCPACGYPERRDDPEKVSRSDRADADDTQFDSFRKWKRPIILVTFAPMFIGIALLAVGMLYVVKNIISSFFFSK